jgi:hypothetical protein
MSRTEYGEILQRTGKQPPPDGPEPVQQQLELETAA